MRLYDEQCEITDRCITREQCLSVLREWHGKMPDQGFRKDVGVDTQYEWSYITPDHGFSMDSLGVYEFEPDGSLMPRHFGCVTIRLTETPGVWEVEKPKQHAGLRLEEADAVPVP